MTHITTLRDLRACIQADTAQSPASEQLEALDAAIAALGPKESAAADRVDFDKLCVALGFDATPNDSCGYADERVNAAWMSWRRPGVDPRGIDAILRATFDAGFEASAQGFNSEYPGGHQDDPTYRHERAVAVNAALKTFQPALSLDELLATAAPDLHAVLHSQDVPDAKPVAASAHQIPKSLRAIFGEIEDCAPSNSGMWVFTQMRTAVQSYFAALAAQPSTPPGMVLVPLHPTRAMDEVMDQPDWQWADLLAEAGAVTLAQYDEAAQPSGQDAEWDADDLSEFMAIGLAVNGVCADLPKGWEVRIDLERDAGVVHLIDPDGNENPIEHDESFSAQITAAIEKARQGGGNGNG